VTWKAWSESIARVEFAPTDLLIEILGVIDVMLRAVVFYIIGVLILLNFPSSKA
jgi:uncharacterized membrane protein YqhA